MAVQLVTIKLPKNLEHDPHNKVASNCETSPGCTDSTGEHHTMLVVDDVEMEGLRKVYHITRVEQISDHRMHRLRVVLEKENTYIDELQVTWKTLVALRDLALNSGEDWDRVSYMSAAIQDIASLIQVAGHELPPISEIRR